MVMSTVMRKMLKLSNNSRKQFTMGEITNLVSVDSQTLLDYTPLFVILWTAPYQITLCMAHGPCPTYIRAP